MSQPFDVSLPAPVALPRGIPRAAIACMALLVAFALLRAGGDVAIADAIYRMEGGSFSWRHAPWLAQGAHAGGRWLSVAAWLGLAAAWLRLRLAGIDAPLRRRLACVLVAVLVSTVLIALFKPLSGMPCPWDLARYGGPWVDAQAGGHCFPAGHAGAGYAWVALGAAARGLDRRVQRAGWGAGIAAGLLFGIAQQLRGAHFASHDVGAVLVCWAVACTVARAGRVGA